MLILLDMLLVLPAVAGNNFIYIKAVFFETLQVQFVNSTLSYSSASLLYPNLGNLPARLTADCQSVPQDLDMPRANR